VGGRKRRKWERHDADRGASLTRRMGRWNCLHIWSWRDHDWIWLRDERELRGSLDGSCEFSG
jgi:hypothetical protein